MMLLLEKLKGTFPVLFLKVALLRERNFKDSKEQSAIFPTKQNGPPTGNKKAK